MRTTVISVSHQLPDLFLAVGPKEIDVLIRALQAVKSDPSRSVRLAAVDGQGRPLANVELYLNESDRDGPALRAVAPACRLVAASG